MNVDELVKRRHELAEQRDSIQKEITSLWTQIEVQLLKELTEAGLFRAKWKSAPENMFLDRLTLYLDDHTTQCHAMNVVTKYDICKGMKSIVLPVKGFRLLIYYGGNFAIEAMSHADNDKVSELVKHFNLNVDTSEYDAKILKLTEERDRLNND